MNLESAEPVKKEPCMVSRKGPLFSQNSALLWLTTVGSLVITSSLIPHATDPQYRTVIFITAGMFGGSLLGLLRIYGHK
jgi:hypothetical protein